LLFLGAGAGFAYWWKFKRVPKGDPSAAYEALESEAVEKKEEKEVRRNSAVEALEQIQ